MTARTDRRAGELDRVAGPDAVEAIAAAHRRRARCWLRGDVGALAIGYRVRHDNRRRVYPARPAALRGVPPRSLAGEPGRAAAVLGDG